MTNNKKVFRSQEASWNTIGFWESLGYEVKVSYTPKGKIIVERS